MPMNNQLKGTLALVAASVVWGITNDQLGFPITICCVLALIAISFGAALVTYPASAKRRASRPESR